MGTYKLGIWLAISIQILDNYRYNQIIIITINNYTVTCLVL